MMEAHSDLSSIAAKEEFDKRALNAMRAAQAALSEGRSFSIRKRIQDELHRAFNEGYFHRRGSSAKRNGPSRKVHADWANECASILLDSTKLKPHGRDWSRAKEMLDCYMQVAYDRGVTFQDALEKSKSYAKAAEIVKRKLGLLVAPRTLDMIDNHAARKQMDKIASLELFYHMVTHKLDAFSEGQELYFAPQRASMTMIYRPVIMAPDVSGLPVLTPADHTYGVRESASCIDRWLGLGEVTEFEVELSNGKTKSLIDISAQALSTFSEEMRVEANKSRQRPWVYAQHIATCTRYADLADACVQSPVPEEIPC